MYKFHVQSLEGLLSNCHIFISLLKYDGMWYIGKVKQSWKRCHEAFNNRAINKKRALIAKLEVAGCPFSALQCEIWEKRGLKVYKRASTYKREQYKLTIHIDSEILWHERTRCTTLVQTKKPQIGFKRAKGLYNIVPKHSRPSIWCQILWDFLVFYLTVIKAGHFTF